NNVRYATFIVRDPRKVLTLVDKKNEAGKETNARAWRIALDAARMFQCEVRELEGNEKWTARDFAPYKIVCLFELPKPSADLWQPLREFVLKGGGLVIVPGGDELDRDSYNEGGKELLPAGLESLVTTTPNKPVNWTSFRGSHALMAQFQAWSKT